jgi:DNA-binding transcriptional regulator YdaS (Cro superfamily)
MTKQKQALLKAIERAGGQTELAERVTVLLRKHPYRPMRKRTLTQAIVAMWVKRGRTPADMCLLIEYVTGVSRYDLRPDTFIAEVILSSGTSPLATDTEFKDVVHG